MLRVTALFLIPGMYWQPDCQRDTKHVQIKPILTWIRKTDSVPMQSRNCHDNPFTRQSCLSILLKVTRSYDKIIAVFLLWNYDKYSKTAQIEL